MRFKQNTHANPSLFTKPCTISMKNIILAFAVTRRNSKTAAQRTAVRETAFV